MFSTATTSRFPVAAVQMSSVQNKQVNLGVAKLLVEQAAVDGAKLVVLPEYFNYLGHTEDVVAVAEPIPGPTSDMVSDLAAQHGIWLVAGSICEQSTTPGMGYNTSLVFDHNGNEVARYRKMHLFDIDLPDGVTFRESDWVLPGDELVVLDTPFGCLGLATCYDLRFPELFRALVDRGMELLAFPSAFIETTGKAHWEILLRARAIENQIHIIAANQAVRQETILETYGHSMILSPWGEVLGSATDESEAVVTAEIDLLRLADIRQRLPALKGRRLCGRLGEEQRD